MILISFPGGLHFVGNVADDCANSTVVDCASVILEDAEFIENRAEHAGGTIFCSDLNAVAIKCRKNAEDSEAEHSAEVIRASSFDPDANTCVPWTNNTAGKYGPDIASYARLSRKTIRYEDKDDSRNISNNTYVVEDHASGTPIPTIEIEVVDALGQGPAIGTNEENVMAVMRSSNNFFTGEVVITLVGGKGSFSGINGYQVPGNYNIQIEFSDSGLEAFEVVVEIRECVIGEEKGMGGLLCVECSGEDYRIVPGTGCTPCPKNAICSTHAIRPEDGYWHRTPCSTHIQKCLKWEACEFRERDRLLADFGDSFKDCDDAVVPIESEDYMQLECKEVRFRFWLRSFANLVIGIRGAAVWNM